MQVISESWFHKIIFTLMLPIIFIAQIFVTVVMLVGFVVTGYILLPAFLGILVLAASFKVLPFWYKTFFDESFVGFDHPLSVEWSDETVTFCGAYFTPHVLPEDILSYKVFGWLRNDSYFVLKIKVRCKDNNIQSFLLTTAMQRKKNFLDFLNARQT